MGALSNLVRDQFRGRTNDQHSDHDLKKKSHMEGFVKSGHILQLKEKPMTAFFANERQRYIVPIENGSSSPPWI